MGTTHLSVVTPNMAVAVTSSINDFFGSGFLSPSTGILLNNDMDGFYLGDVRFPLNKIQPRKRPLSAKCPTVVVDSEGNFKLVTGAAGGKRIPPAVGQVSEWIYTTPLHVVILPVWLYRYNKIKVRDYGWFLFQAHNTDGFVLYLHIIV